LISAVDFLNKGIHCDFYIVSSGSIVYDKDQNIIYEQPIAHEDAKKVLEMLPEEGLSITTDKEFYIAKGMDFLVKKPVYTNAFDINSDEVVISISANMPSEELAAKTKQELENIQGIAVHQNQHCLDITADGCSKGNGLLKAAQHFGLLQKDTYGIGDSYNDLPLIEQAAVSFTFHDAPASVQEKADHVVNGIAQALQIVQK
jgi:HAD superfamily hydrolase (TIGR01484 family)